MKYHQCIGISLVSTWYIHLLKGVRQATFSKPFGSRSLCKHHLTHMHCKHRGSTTILSALGSAVVFILVILSRWSFSLNITCSIGLGSWWGLPPLLCKAFLQLAPPHKGKAEKQTPAQWHSEGMKSRRTDKLGPQNCQIRKAELQVYYFLPLGCCFSVCFPLSVLTARNHCAAVAPFPSILPHYGKTPAIPPPHPSKLLLG